MRELAPQTLATLTRRYGHFGHGRGRGPGGVVGRRHGLVDGRAAEQPGRLADHSRRPTADRLVARRAGPPPARADRRRTALPIAMGTSEPLSGPDGDRNDSLVLLFWLSPGSHAAGSGRAHSARRRGLTTTEIAHGLLLPEATITRRITRAKQSIRAARGPIRPARTGRVGRPARRGTACALPRLHRGPHSHGRGCSRPQRLMRGGHSARSAGTPAAARRARGRRTARADAAH